MTTHNIELDVSSRYDRETYGIVYTGRVLHKINGAKHNPRSLFLIKVWDNTVRPNPHPGETRYTDFGSIGGDGKYLSPNNKGTDDEFTVTCSPEPVVIAARPLPQKGQGVDLSMDDLVILRTPAGNEFGPYKLDQRPLHDPEFVAVECDGCDQDPWTPAVHYGTCPLAPARPVRYDPGAAYAE